ncbi:MAG: hypothetical protein SOZ08_01390 [Erysipelotrichaceae bacterium]|nr:hypothetical protein [Erysipelotrichaceae bacterium]
MPKKASGEFNQSKYINNWANEKHGAHNVQYKKEFTEKFKAPCKKLGVSQSEVIRAAMEETIRKAEEI